MPDLDILHQMIQEAAKIPLQEDSYGNSIVTLTESQCPDSSVVVHKMSERAIIINVDDFWSLEGMFTHENGQCKRADFVIIADTGKHKAIVYIELKRQKASRKDIVQQLTGAQCFIAYCRELVQTPGFWNQQDFLKGYEERFVCISNTSVSINKRPIRINPKKGIHDCPERMLKLNAPSYISLDRLIESGS